MGSVASGPHRSDFLLTVTKPPTATGDLFQSEVHGDADERLARLDREEPEDIKKQRDRAMN
jgi:hypothetical protein